jgi:archaellum biogenesis ATPase FlaH
MLKNYNKELVTVDKTQYYPSRFKFLNSHYGIRKNSFSVLLGGSGKGKSSIMKAIIADASKSSKVAVYLTEETQEEYEPMLHWCDPIKENIYFLEERKLGTGSEDDRFLAFKETLLDPEIEIVFFDNITTSRFYQRLQQQENFIDRLYEFSKRHKSIFIASHTKKEFKDNGHTLITGNETRGTGMLYQKAEYFYCLQSFNVGNNIFPVMYIDKHRHFQIEQKYFLMGYDMNAYRFDKPINFDEIKTIYKKRNTL